MLETLSNALGLRFGRGFSTANLRYFRLFYQAYADRRARIHHEPRDGESEQIFAARYVTYLPTIEELERELLRELGKA